MAVIPAVPLNLKPMTMFDACLKTWHEECQKIINKAHEHYEHVKAPTLVQEGGKTYIKFIKVGTQRMVYAFVDARNGNIYKPATWKAPALNHARGNILDDKNGLGWMNDHGPAYMDGKRT